jgi:hypothetical protein
MWLRCTPVEVQNIGGVRRSLACAARLPHTLIGEERFCDFTLNSGCDFSEKKKIVFFKMNYRAK